MSISPFPTRRAPKERTQTPRWARYRVVLDGRVLAWCTDLARAQLSACRMGGTAERIERRAH